MFFEKEFVAFEIIDIFELNQKNVKAITQGRSFNALSFRYRADTHILTKNEDFHLKDNTVAFVPAKFEYVRETVIDQLIVVHFKIFNAEFDNFEYFTPHSQSKLSTFFIKLFDLWQEKGLDYKYKCASVLHQIFAECYTQNYASKPNHSKINNSVDYMKKFFNKDINLFQIAQQSFMSEVYFRKLFKQEYGISPQKYLINLRLKYATELMSIDYHTLKEIAFLCGYKDYKYFLTEFKKHFGTSPSEYIKNKC